MPLATHVTDPNTTQYLRQVTNPQNPNATTVNTTLLGFAADDVDALFEVYSGVAYDDANQLHIAVAVDGVISFLLQRTGQSAAQQRMDTWIAAMRSLSRVEGRNRITPDSNTLMQPSADDRLTVTPRPAFDDRFFDRVLPGSPREGLTVEDFG